MEHTMITNIQKAMFHEFVNGFEPRNNTVHVENGTVMANLLYGEKYPNSFCDLYQSPAYKGKPLPVIIYCHGGGYVWGDKAEGDPNVKEQGFWLFQAYLDAGYQLVSVNYALAPEYQYPVPLYQLDQCVSYLTKHAVEYGLDMTQVILAGGSAGAHLVGQYTNLVTNPDYARKVGITPKLQSNQIIALISNSGLLDCERFDKTDSIPFNGILRECARAYFGCDTIQGNKTVRETNVITNMTKDFPPCFISDGNTGTFTDQARDMAKRAEELLIRHKLWLYPKSVAELGHGFENGSTEQAKETVELTIAFLKEAGERTV